MAGKTAEGQITIYLRGGGTIELRKGKAEITLGGFGRTEEMRFSADGGLEILHLDTSEVIAVTVKKPSEAFVA